MHYDSAKANPKLQKEARKQLRNNATPSEAILWRALRGRNTGGYKFRRQQGIGAYILDFYCPELRLCIELDGSSHDHKYDYDERRTAFLNEQGIKVVRFQNDLVLANVDAVAKEIVRIGKEMQGKATAE